MKKLLLLSLLLLSNFAVAFKVPDEIVWILDASQEYNILRKAVFKKMEHTDFANIFNKVYYLLPSKKRVETLFHYIDEKPNFWFLSNPPQTSVSVGGQDIKIRGKIAHILWDLCKSPEFVLFDNAAKALAEQEPTTASIDSDIDTDDVESNK